MSFDLKAGTTAKIFPGLALLKRKMSENDKDEKKKDDKETKKEQGKGNTVEDIRKHIKDLTAHITNLSKNRDKSIKDNNNNNNVAPKNEWDEICLGLWTQDKQHREKNAGGRCRGISIVKVDKDPKKLKEFRPCRAWATIVLRTVKAEDLEKYLKEKRDADALKKSKVVPLEERLKKFQDSVRVKLWDVNTYKSALSRGLDLGGNLFSNAGEKLYAHTEELRNWLNERSK